MTENKLTRTLVARTGPVQVGARPIALDRETQRRRVAERGPHRCHGPGPGRARRPRKARPAAAARFAAAGAALCAALGLLAACGGAAPPQAARGAALTHGPLVGGLAPGQAVVWARTSRPASLQAVATPVEGGAEVRAWLETRAEEDGTGQTLLEGLQADTDYRLRLLGADPPGAARFRSAPAPETGAAWRLAFGGDLAGQNVCRDAERGFPVFEAMRSRAPDLFLGLGDMIYADGVCEPVGSLGNRQVIGHFPRSLELEDFFAHWRYSREDPAFRELLARTAYLPVWDDHEVVNDFGPAHATREGPAGRPVELLAKGRRAFLAWNPVAPAEGPSRLVRRTRLGRHMEIFLLDTRSHRDPNAAPDSAAEPKSMLGAAQRAWLVDALAASDATWKLVVSSVPIGIPTGSQAEEKGRDGWSDMSLESGFERELHLVFEALRDADVDGLVFLTTDVHFASVLRYRPFPEDPAFVVREVVTGPLNAGLAPPSFIERLDPTFGPERLFLHAPPEGLLSVDSFEAALEWFNFGLLDVDEAGTLRVRIVNARNAVVYDARWTAGAAADPAIGSPARSEPERRLGSRPGL